MSCGPLVYPCLELLNSRAVRESRIGLVQESKAKLFMAACVLIRTGTSSHDATKVCDTMFGTSVGMEFMGSWALERGMCDIPKMNGEL